MDSTFAARAARVANNQAPSSESLSSPSSPQFHPAGLQNSHGKAQPPLPETHAAECALQLMRALRAPETYERVNVYCSRKRSERPLLISRNLLMRTSAVLAAMLNRRGLLYDRNALRLDTKFSVLAVFVYWLYQHQVPEPEDFDGEYREPSDRRDRGAYQIILVESWVFAQNWLIPKLQNAIMAALFHTFSKGELGADVLETCLRISSKGSAMRYALIGYMLWSDDLQEQVGLHEDERLLADLADISHVDGFEKDFAIAAEMFEWKGRELDRLSETNMDAMQTHVVGMPAGRERPRAERYFEPEG